MAITIKDVAKAAGVSFKTVSRVLNDDPAVRVATRRRVLEAAQSLDYRPHQSARQLRTQTSETIGFITDEIATSPHAGNIIKGAQFEAWRHHKLLLVVNTDLDASIEKRAVDMMLERGVDGIVFAAMYHRAVSPPTALEKVPTVLVDCFDEARKFASVVPNEVQGGYAATSVLLERGYRCIGFINVHPVQNAPAATGRLEGYRLAHETFRVPVNDDFIRFGNTDADQGYLETLALMSMPNPPTALFCGTDRTAMGAYDALRELGLRIPKDIAVIGFDNQELIANFLRPALSTVALPHFEMGRWAVRYLLKSLKGVGYYPIQHKIPCPLVLRASLGESLPARG